MSKTKPVNYRFIDAMSADPVEEAAHKLLDQLVRDHHPDLIDAGIALMWRFGLKPDSDGKITLGTCQKVTDKMKELASADYAFVITLNHTFWTALETSDQQRAALLDHELCHAVLCKDEDGESIFDDRGRPTYRIRKHDIEEFSAIVARHGCYKSDLEAFAQALASAPKGPMLFKLAVNE